MLHDILYIFSVKIKGIALEWVVKCYVRLLMAQKKTQLYKMELICIIACASSYINVFITKLKTERNCTYYQEKKKK